MKKFEIGDIVRRKNDLSSGFERTGEIVEINPETNRAKISWTYHQTHYGDKRKFTWNKLDKLVEAEYLPLFHSSDYGYDKELYKRDSNS